MNVYLTTDGACSQGHGPEDIQDVYEVLDPAATSSAGAQHGTVVRGEPQKKSKTLLIVLIVVAVVLLGGCLAATLLSAIAVPVFDSARVSAEERACFANQRVIEGAALQTYADTGAYPPAIIDLVNDGYITAVPECAARGDYIYSASEATVECTEHGRYE